MWCRIVLVPDSGTMSAPEKKNGELSKKKEEPEVMEVNEEK